MPRHYIYTVSYIRPHQVKRGTRSLVGKRKKTGAEAELQFSWAEFIAKPRFGMEKENSKRLDDLFNNRNV